MVGPVHLVPIGGSDLPIVSDYTTRINTNTEGQESTPKVNTSLIYIGGNTAIGVHALCGHMTHGIIISTDAYALLLVAKCTVSSIHNW